MVTQTATTLDTTKPSLLGKPTGSLVLRICNTEYLGREFRVSLAKITVGSAASCSIRLPGLEPFHCLIVRGERQVVVRRWASQGLMNGYPFRDAPLTRGDRLSLGPYELEVVSLGGDYSPDRRIEELLGQLETLRQELADSDHLREQARAFREQTATLREEKASLAERFNQLISERRQEGEERQRLTAELQQAIEERSRLEAELRVTGSLCDEQAGQLAQLRMEREQLTHERSRLEEQLRSIAARGEEQSERLGQMQAERDRLIQERGRVETQLQAIESRCREQTGLLEQLQAERDLLDEDRSRLESELGATGARCQEQAGQLQQVLAERDLLDEDHSQLEAELQAIKVRYDEQTHRLEQFKAEQARLDEERSRLQAQLQATGVRFSEQAGRLEQVQAERDLLDVERQRLEAELRASSQRFGEQAAHFEKLRAERYQLSEDRSRLEDQLQTIVGRFNEQSRMLESLQAERDQLHQERERLEQQLQASGVRSDEQAEHLNQLRAELSQSRSELEASESQLAESQRRVDELEATCRELEAAREEALAAQIEAAAHERVAWQQQVDQLSAQAADWQRQLETAVQTHATALADWTRQRQRAEEYQQELRERIHDVEQQAVELSDARARDIVELEQLRGRCAELEKLLQSAQEALAEQTARFEPVVPPDQSDDGRYPEHAQPVEQWLLGEVGLNQSQSSAAPAECEASDAPSGEEPAASGHRQAEDQVDSFAGDPAPEHDGPAAVSGDEGWTEDRPTDEQELSDAVKAEDDDCLILGDETGVASDSSESHTTESGEGEESADVLLRLQKLGLWHPEASGSDEADEENPAWHEAAHEEAVEPSAGGEQSQEWNTSSTEEAPVEDEVSAEVVGVVTEVDVATDVGDAGATQADNTEGDSDDAIQSYMDRLMKRLRGQGDDELGVREKTRPTAQKAPPVETAPAKPAAPVQRPAVPVVVDLVRPEEFVPKSSAPPVDMQAMRDLANSTARSALQTYERRRGKESARSHLTYAAVAFFGGLASLLLVWEASPVAGWIGAGLGFGVACILGMAGLMNATRLRQPEQTEQAE